MNEKNKKKVFYSIEEIWNEYFPESTETEEIEDNPEEYGRKLATKAIEVLKREMDPDKKD